MYHGRFAPSPTGPLHIGSLFTAVASYLDARANNGFWHLRIDDLDTYRIVPGSTTKILSTLESAGLTWDGPVLYQSQQTEKYEAALIKLDRQQLLYRCTCSRKSLREFTENNSSGIGYPGICRNKNNPSTLDHAIRIKTSQASIEFDDKIQGRYMQNIARQVGDFIVRRRDGIHAYQLAVVIDDVTQNINCIVRGIDLMDSTPRQIFLHNLMDLPVPSYSHVPVIINCKGVKLSKQTGAAPVETANIGSAVYKVLGHLKHSPPTEMEKAPATELLRWATNHWQIEKLASVQSIS